MRNEFKNWVKSNVPAGRAWTVRVLTVAAAGTATAAVWLSVVLMAGLDLAPGELPVAAQAPAATPANAAPAAQQSVRYASALPPVTIVGRREPGANPAPAAAKDVSAAPARPASGESMIGMSAAGDNLRQ